MIMAERPQEITRTYFLSAGETDAEGCMPMARIFERVIEVATDHANILNIGYAKLIESGIGWVLTRMSVEMLRYPRINETYSLTTWIEGFNRLYSDRCFVLCDADGNEIGHIRTMWMAIDIKKRTAADLTQYEDDLPIGTRKCPVEMQRKLPPLTEISKENTYTFRFSDLDFNRHVNTVQYVRLLLNQWPLEFFDANEISRFDIAFHQECHFGETVEIRLEGYDPCGCVPHDDTKCEIVREGKRAVAAVLSFRHRSE